MLAKQFSKKCHSKKHRFPSIFENIFWISFFYLLFPIQYGIAGNIIDTSDYPYWRELASNSAMYKAMKASAVDSATATGRTLDIMGTNALAYILDPANKSRYVDHIKTGFETNVDRIVIGTGAIDSSVPSHELFHALLALDVIRYDLDPATLANYETILQSKIFKLFIGKWDPHAWAMRMLWYKYKGDMPNFLKAKIEFDIGLKEHYLPDGVSPAGSGYCIQRFNSIERSAKNTTLDILEYMGYHEYYSNPGIIGLHEFMYGYANSPFARSIFYGDTRGGQVAWNVRGNVIISPTIVKSARFCEKAYQYAMWVLREGPGLTNPTLKGYLASYLVMAGPASKNNPLDFNIEDAQMAPSRIFHNYAALIGNKQSRNALYMSVQTLTAQPEYHTHYEANAIAMAGYGEILLRNAGYNGPDKDVSAGGVRTPFEFIHAHAESANTVMIDGKNHSGKLGSGTVQGILGEDIEYVRASNSNSIEGEHFRDMLFVQPSDHVNGYYVVMDHVTVDQTGNNVNVVWHPNSAILNTVQENTQYHSEIIRQKGDAGPVIFNQNNPKLTTFLGTPPTSVEKKVMVNQSSGSHYAAQYLYTTYPAANKKADILTVLFPGDKTHEIGNMTRITSGDYSGSEIIQGQVRDIALISSGTSVGKNGTESFQAEDVIYRKVSGNLISYFVKGLSFDDGQSIRRGFQAESAVAVYMKGVLGKITSSGTTVTFYYPGISSVELNGSAVPPAASGPNWSRVQVPKGTFAVEIITRNR